MQPWRLWQNVHNQILIEKTLGYTLSSKTIRVCDLSEEVRSRIVPEGTHVYPHGWETIQVPFWRLWQELQASREAVSAQEVPLEQIVHRAEDEEENRD